MNILYELTEKIDKLIEKDIQSDEFSNVTNELKTLVTPYKKGSTGIAQINTIAGDIEYNAKKIMKYVSCATKINLDLVVFPDFTLIGYPIADVIRRHKIIAQDNLNWLKGIAQKTDKTTVLLGFVEPVEENNQTTYYNSAAILADGEIKGLLRKSAITEAVEKQGVLGIFPAKYLGMPATDQNITNDIYIINGIKYGFLNNTKTLRANKADILIISSLSINNAEKEQLRKQEVQNLSEQLKTTIITINPVGATDNVSYTGGSYIYSNGTLFAQAKSFEEQLLIINPTMNIGKIYPSIDYIETKNTKFTLDYEADLERTYKVILQGVKDYFSKNGIKRACLGLSGGLDSSVCAVIMADALGKENVYGLSMPSKITSKESRTDAEQLASNLGIHYTEIPIKEVFDTTDTVFSRLFEQIEKSWNCRYKKSFTKDNIQARARATYLWGVSNEFESCIPIATSDKSEAYMGYATINGDMSGGFAPIADVTKTKLFALAKWLNKNRPEKNAIPESIILKHPGAELAIDEKTGKPLIAEDALMPYEFLDEIIWRIENNKETYDDMLNSEFLYEVKAQISKEQKKEWLDKFYRRMSSALYKWSIVPPSVSVEPQSINKSLYQQPITTSNINYKGSTPEKIISKLNR